MQYILITFMQQTWTTVNTLQTIMANLCYDDSFFNNGNNAGVYQSTCNTYSSNSIGIFQKNNTFKYVCQKCKLSQINFDLKKNV